MPLFRRIGRLLKGAARVGLGFATGGPTGALGAGIRELSRGAQRRQARRTRVPDPRLGPQFQGVPAPFVDTRRTGGRRSRSTTDLVNIVRGGGGSFAGGGAGGSFGPAIGTGGTGLPGGATIGGVDLSSVAIAMAPNVKTVVMPRAGFVTVTLPWQAFGFPAGSKVQLMTAIAVKLGLHKRRRKPLLSAGDMDALRRADRVSRKLVGLTTKHTDFKCVTKATAARSRAAARSSRKR